MKQQVNLYQEQFHIKRVALPARRIIVIELAVVGLLVLASGVLQWSVHSTKTQGDRLLAGKQQLEQVNAQMKQAVARQSVDKALEARVTAANEELQARKKVLEWVTESQERNRVTFSALLEGPARRHVNGLWLSRIGIEQAGFALQLTGNVLDPEMVPEFLTRLQKEPAYLGREFRKLILEQDEEAAGMRFLLTTVPPQKDGVALSEWNKRSKRQR